jgi:hypothetical protein
LSAGRQRDLEEAPHRVIHRSIMGVDQERPAGREHFARMTREVDLTDELQGKGLQIALRRDSPIGR